MACSAREGGWEVSRLCPLICGSFGSLLALMNPLCALLRIKLQIAGDYFYGWFCRGRGLEMWSFGGVSAWGSGEGPVCPRVSRFKGGPANPIVVGNHHWDRGHPPPFVAAIFWKVFHCEQEIANAKGETISNITVSNKTTTPIPKP